VSVLLPLTATQTFPSGTCFNSEQERLLALAGALSAILSGQAFYNYGASRPDPSNNSYPWLRTTDMRWYRYEGGWISPVLSYDLNERRLWVGTTVQLQTYDGGDTNAPSDRSGPMWIQDLSFTAKYLVHPGTFAGGTSVAVNTNVGADEVTLTADELPDASVAPLDGTGAVTSNRTVQKTGVVTGITGQNGDFSGTDSGGVMSDVLLKIEGNNQPFEILPPGRGIFVIQRTARQYYFIP
jgi:hypothetical protein